MRKFIPAFFSGWRTVVASCLVFVAALVAGYYGGLTFAFTGPGSSAGSGSGAIAADGLRVTIGSSTVPSNTMLTVVASTTGSSNYALRVVSPASSPLLIARDDGNVGVASSSPGYKLVVSGAVDNLFGLERSGASSPTIFKLGTDSALVISNGGTDLLTLKSGNVGIASSSPGAIFSVGAGTGFRVDGSGNVVTGSWQGTAVGATKGGTGQTAVATGDILYGSATNAWSRLEVGANGECLKLAAGIPDWDTCGGSGSPGGSSGHVQFNNGAGGFGGDANLFWDNTSKRLGIGTTTPSTQLSVGTNTSALVAVFGGGSGKIDAGTIDPVYTIGGGRYATYLPAMTGVKEETTGVIKLKVESSKEIAKYTIDFNDLEKGSDLWLFSKVTNLKENFENLAVLLTPSFEGDVWYEKDAATLRLTVFARPSMNFRLSTLNLELSYRLTAPRFDADQWLNASDSVNAGFIIND
jgi:hypothetical protein